MPQEMQRAGPGPSSMRTSSLHSSSRASCSRGVHGSRQHPTRQRVSRLARECCSSSSSPHSSSSSHEPSQQQHSSCSSSLLLPHRCCWPPSCLRNSTSHRRSGPLTSRAARLPPPAASLAFAEPTPAALGSVSGSAAASTAAAAAGSLSFSQVLAVVLGYCVMAGSLFRSVPQIVKVVQHNSTEGLSLMSYVVELCCYSVVIAYNMGQGYGFNTFGEVVACWIQDIILIALVFKDRRTQPWVVVLAAAAFTAGCGFLLSPACPQQLLSTMQASNIAIMALGSRLPQILLNMRRGNAGMLSVTTCLLNVAGNAARIFTTIVLTGDLLMLGGACSQGCLNTILLWQSISTARARRSTGAGAASGSNGSSATQQQQQQPKQQRPQTEAGSNGPEGPAGGFPALQPAT